MGLWARYDKESFIGGMKQSGKPDKHGKHGDAVPTCDGYPMWLRVVLRC